MATDVKLDQQGGNWLVLEGAVVKATATDLMLDAPGRRRNNLGHRRALVHDFNDGLTLNYGGDYPGGVTVTGNLAVTGDVVLDGAGVRATLSELGSAIRSAGSHGPRLDVLEQTIASLVELIGAAVVPQWLNKTEIDEGDDMGMRSPSAESLGLVIEYVYERQVPGFGHEDVIAIDPAPGSVVMRGSTVVVTLNLEG